MASSALFAFAMAGLSVSLAHAGAHETAQVLFRRLAGIPIASSDPRLAQMEAMIAAGNYDGAAAIATADNSFLNVTVRGWACPLSSRTDDPLEPLNDFCATIIGVTRDDHDARELLIGNYIYKADTSVNRPGATAGSAQDIHTDANVYKFSGANEHYAFLESTRQDLATVLVQAPQKGFDASGNTATVLPVDMAAGLLTTKAWANSHLEAGTNRRAVEFSFRQFLCLPIAAMKDSTLPDDRVRRDVDRFPQGLPTVFQQNCKGCHSILDGNAGAFAYLDNGKDRANATFLLYSPGTVRPKYNINSTVYPAGAVPSDDSWVNYANQNSNAKIGWNSALSGRGPRAFGEMIAMSDAYPACMAKRVMERMCRRPADPTFDAQAVSELAQDFKANGYHLKRLFQKAAVHPACLPRQ
jgi:hypothetical protein